MKVNFTRKPTPEEIYPQSEFIIEKVVRLKPEEFKELITHPLEDREYADSGLTGRKIICDTYGGVAHHGGGAFSGKDPSKVDRSGAYYCRFVAKTLVDAGFCKRCEVGVAYSIGVAEPVSILVDSFGTGIVSDEELSKIVKENFDFKPASIKHELKLLYTKYQDTAYFGHFGRKDLNLPWEDTNAKAQEISKAYAKTK